MAIYEVKSDSIAKIDETTFQNVGLKERGDLQRLLRAQIEIVCPGTLVIAEEFGQWEDSKRRIDLLGVDRNANLVVIELKRTEDGGHMELQALRYAAMVSAMTFDRAVLTYGVYLEQIDSDLDPQSSLLEFLEWDEPDDDAFAQDVEIVLVSADFSKELTTSVLWLNNRDLDIRCVRMKPYRDGDRALVDVQQVIPLPETEQYQVQLKEKTQKGRSARQKGRDYTKYDVTIDGKRYERLSKGRTVFTIVKRLCSLGISPDDIRGAVSSRKNNAFRGVQDEVDRSDEFVRRCIAQQEAGGRRFDPWRYFTDDNELIVFDGRTFCVSKQWGPGMEQWLSELLNAFPQDGIEWRRSDDVE